MLLLVQATLHKVQSYEAMLDIICQVELFRLLFYSMLPVCLLTLLAPRKPFKTSRSRIFGASCLALAPLPAAALSCAPLIVYSSVGLRQSATVSGIGIGLNLAFAGWMYLDWPQRGLNRLLRCAPPASDLLLPLPVWVSISRDASAPRWLSAIMRVNVLALLAGCCLLPWLWDPLSASNVGRYDRSVELVFPGIYYQVAIDPLGGDLLLVDETSNTVFKIDPHDRSVRGVLRFTEGTGVVQAVAIDGPHRRLVSADNKLDRVSVADLDEMKPLTTIPYSDDSAQSNGLCRTYWFEQRRLLCSVCVDGLRVFCDSGRAVRAHLGGPPGDMAYDPRRNELLYATINGGLSALNVESLEVTRSVALGAWSEKLALDGKRDRLFISQPYLARVLVFDLERFEPVAEIAAMPGVRELLIDEARDLLFIGSLSPLMEVRDLKSLNLVARLSAPSWTRWIEFDARSDRLYFTTGFNGLYRLDPTSIEVETVSSAFRRADPFYALFRQVAVAGGNRYGRRLTMSEAPIRAAQYVFYGECAGPPWYDVDEVR